MPISPKPSPGTMPDLEAEHAITRLFAAYAHALDAGRIDEVVEMFTEDGVFDAAIGGEVRGRANLHAYYSSQLTEPEWEPYRGGQHFASNLKIDVDRDRATATADLMLILPGDPSPRITFLGKYDDELARVGDTWRFTRRRTIQNLAR
jgi:ketosteroid isomerase-like protein